MKKDNKNKEKIIYYSDELNDEFSEDLKIETRKIDEKFKYNKSRIWEFFSFLFQNILSMPIKILYLKIKFHHKFIGKEKIKDLKKYCEEKGLKYKKCGFFIYSNHTQPFSDTFTPSLIAYPKRNFLIVNPKNISLKGTGWLVEMLGAIPIPSNISASKKFINRLENRIKKGYSISVYPEAHIWPYYTKIRPFKSVSFSYPVNFNCPVFVVTNTYQKRNKNSNKIKVNMVSYIDGPFFPDSNLNKKEAQVSLRNKVYETMKNESKHNNVEVIKYIKK